MEGTKGNTPRETNINLCRLIEIGKAQLDALQAIQTTLDSIYALLGFRLPATPGEIASQTTKPPRSGESGAGVDVAAPTAESGPVDNARPRARPRGGRSSRRRRAD